MGKLAGILGWFRPQAQSTGPVPINSTDGINLLRMGASSGVSVNEHTAMSVSAVYACVRIISESIASLPCKVYRKTPQGREEADGAAIWELLRRMPNEWQTPMEFFEMNAGITALRGNAYNWIKRDRGEIKELIPIPTDEVGVMKRSSSGEPVYQYKGQALPHTEILHFKGITRNGYLGISPLHELRETFGLSIAGRNFAANTFGNGATPLGILDVPGDLDDKQKEQLQNWIQEKHSGPNNAGKPLVTWGGMKWQAISITPEDAQMLESRRFEVEEIARAYRIPRHLLADTQGSTSWGTGIEQMNIGFIEYTLRPWLVRFEQAMNKVLLTELQKDQGYYIEFNLDALLRGDFKARMEGYKSGIQSGIYTLNDVRKLENLPKLPANIGDVTYMPLNIGVAGSNQNQSQEIGI